MEYSKEDLVEGKEKGFLQHRVETTASGVILAKAGRNALYRISSSRKRETNFCGSLLKNPGKSQPVADPVAIPLPGRLPGKSP